MPKRVLMGGNVAVAEGAILAGCDAYFGYPITPQNEILEQMAKRMPEEGRVFVQTESELAAISMIYGASASGCNAMTSTSSPGFSLQQEGISYLSGAQLPAVIVNVMRGGPGLGNIGGAQGDYFQCTKGGGHGDYRRGYGHVQVHPVEQYKTYVKQHVDPNTRERSRPTTDHAHQEPEITRGLLRDEHGSVKGADLAIFD